MEFGSLFFQLGVRSNIWPGHAALCHIFSAYLGPSAAELYPSMQLPNIYLFQLTKTYTVTLDLWGTLHRMYHVVYVVTHKNIHFQFFPSACMILIFTYLVCILCTAFKMHISK